MKGKRQPIPKQDPKERVKNFREVVLGYNEIQVINEAKRCLGCKVPKCKEACPIELDIPSFIKPLKEAKFREASLKIRESNPLPAFCGRVCPQEVLCEKACVLGEKGEALAIGKIERFLGDYILHEKTQKQPFSNGLEVAVIGSGPAGLTVAGELARMGYKVTVFEALHAPGGVLRYGIPEFRLPNEVLDREVEYLKRLGVEIKCNVVVGKVFGLFDLFRKGFKAIFIGTGAGLPYFLGIEGENLNGVYTANEYLTRINLMKAYKFPDYDTPIVVGKRVAVVGGGNVAVDCARVSLRMKAEEVLVLYRRGREEMPAREEEVLHAEEEGVIFQFLVAPLRIIGDREGWVKAVECIRMELGEVDKSGRRRPIPIKGSEFRIDIDTVVVAIGQGPNPLLPKATPELQLTEKGTIKVDERGATSIKGVYAGGDIVSGAATVISAVEGGKRAACAIHEYLSKY